MPSAVGAGDHLGVVGVARDDSLPFERPGDQVAVEQDDPILVRLSGLAIAPMLFQVLQELESVGR